MLHGKEHSYRLEEGEIGLMWEFFRRGEEIAWRQEEENTNNASAENLIQRVSLGGTSATVHHVEYL